MTFPKVLEVSVRIFTDRITRQVNEYALLSAYVRFSSNHTPTNPPWVPVVTEPTVKVRYFVKKIHRAHFTQPSQNPSLF